MNILTGENLIRLNADIYNISEIEVNSFFSEVLITNDNVHNYKLLKQYVIEDKQFIIQLNSYEFRDNYAINLYEEDLISNIRLYSIERLINNNRIEISKNILNTFYESTIRNYNTKFKWYHKYNIRPTSIIKSPYDISTAIRKSAEKISAKLNLTSNQYDIIVVCNIPASRMIAGMPNFKYSDINNKFLYGTIEHDIQIQVDNNLESKESIVNIYIKPKNRHINLGGFIFYYNPASTCLNEIELPITSHIKNYSIQLQTMWGIKLTYEDLDVFTDKIIIKDYTELSFLQKIFKFLYK